MTRCSRQGDVFVGLCHNNLLRHGVHGRVTCLWVCVTEVTRADVEVQNFPFTTKSLFLGHLDYKYLQWQVIDTPGLLDRSIEERNTIEMQVRGSNPSPCALLLLDIYQYQYSFNNNNEGSGYTSTSGPETCHDYHCFYYDCSYYYCYRCCCYYCCYCYC
jgi:hypothetical protein